MTRAKRLSLLTTLLTALYLLVFFQVLAVPLVDESTVQKILPVFPWWILVSFGSYSLWSLGWGLFTFRDCPEAYTGLLGEITRAKMICVHKALPLIDTLFGTSIQASNVTLLFRFPP
ncbi:Dolichol-phosphate mannosyltransferase subunit 3 [Hypsizygus marmoreus]|uniref:Dolichol-phosphate mannosyltransferase subunit 3 n=1 Tax=Hypsizygus marmoreus TaxID=39966 RepID=A0A369J6Z4_HYPMA|nr:Dolichol-phosphate mannosyltransferase subunit 3 [Hypsizygus marmoreus]